MNDTIIESIVILLVAHFLASISQVILKKAAMLKRDYLWQEYINSYVVIAYILFFVTIFMSIYALKYIPLSMGAVIECSSYIYILILGKICFNERITFGKVLGTIFIFLGIVVYCFL